MEWAESLWDIFGILLFVSGSNKIKGYLGSQDHIVTTQANHTI